MKSMAAADRTYSRVMRAFRKTPAASYRTIARRVGVAPSTVGMAVERAIREGSVTKVPCQCCGATMLQFVVGANAEAV